MIAGFRRSGRARLLSRRLLVPALLCTGGCRGASVELRGSEDGHPPATPPSPPTTGPGDAGDAGDGGCGIETCDGVDDDCDGLVDEWAPGSNEECRVALPAGSFEMGCVPSDASCEADEHPRHMVTLGAYAIDVHEVVQLAYERCVIADVCVPPSSNYEPADTPLHPVTRVDLAMAATYCQWRGGRLPTEAEWERAARDSMGTIDAVFPWGALAPSCALANFADCDGGPERVGGRPGGWSGWGVGDLAGNVLEWTLDHYDAAYYATSPSENPQGPVVGDTHVVRGGSFLSTVTSLRASARFEATADSAVAHLGFRCVYEL